MTIVLNLSLTYPCFVKFFSRGFIFFHLEHIPLFSCFSLNFGVCSYVLGKIAISSVLKEWSQEDWNISVCYLCSALWVLACQELSDWFSPTGPRNTSLPGHWRHMFKGPSLCGLPYLLALAEPKRSTRPRQSCLPALTAWGHGEPWARASWSNRFGGAEPQKSKKAGQTAFTR